MEQVVQGLIGDGYDSVSLKVMAKLAGGHDNCIGYFFQVLSNATWILLELRMQSKLVIACECQPFLFQQLMQH